MTRFLAAMCIPRTAVLISAINKSERKTSPRRHCVMKAKLHFLENDDVPSILNPAGPAPHIAGTKVIATIGPACHEVEQLVELLECGMSCARVDLTVRAVWNSFTQQCVRIQTSQYATWFACCSGAQWSITKSRCSICSLQ